MTINLFEYATREKLRFDSLKNGLISVEDLWDLPLSSPTKANLNDIGIDVRRQLKALDDAESLVNESSATTLKTVALQAKFDLIKHIIAVKKADAAALADAKAQAETRQKAMAEIERRKDATLTTLTEEELRKLAGLSG